MKFTMAMLFYMIFALACAEVGTLRFKNQDPIWYVNDRNDVPKKPKELVYYRYLYHFDALIGRRLTRLMEVPEPKKAASINALDEVPNSTWFTNRIGLNDLSVEDVRRGPNTDDGPDRSAPWKVVGTKVGGVSVGLQIKDAKGVRYLLKFDVPGEPDLETGADVVVQRLFWALGYFVSEDSIVYFSRNQLILDEKAVVRDLYGNKRPMTQKDLDDALNRVNQLPNGRFRGLVSKFLPGVPVGGYAQEGIRKDDPNDKIPHEERRELRAQYVFFGWVAHTDLHQGNWLDMWIEYPNDPTKHYIQHNLIDFGKALGVQGYLAKDPSFAFKNLIDYENMAQSTLAFGLWKRTWEGVEEIKVPRGIGWFESEYYDPATWDARNFFIPFARADKFDAFWASKIMIRLTPDHIRAAVEAGKYEDPAATEFLTRILVERQRKTAHYWFNQVNPLDRFDVSSTAENRHALCFDDLLLKYGLELPNHDTSYSATVYDKDGTELWQGQSTPELNARTCLSGFPTGKDQTAYTIVKLDTQRNAQKLPPVFVHLARSPKNQTLRPIGIDRR